MPQLLIPQNILFQEIIVGATHAIDINHIVETEHSHLVKMFFFKLTLLVLPIFFHSFTLSLLFIWLHT